MKKTFLCVGALLTMLMLGLAGCGQDAGKGTSDTAAAGMNGGAEQTEGTAEYYIMEETAIPNTDQAFEAEVSDGGRLFYGDPRLLGDYVYRNTMVAKKEEGAIYNTVYNYERLFNVNDSTWEESALYGGYVVEGEKYYGTQPYRSPDGQTYAIVQKKDQCYLAYHVSVVYPGEEEDAFSFRDRILLQVSTGEGPDILGDDMVIDVASLVDGGYLECL